MRVMGNMDNAPTDLGEGEPSKTHSLAGSCVNMTDPRKVQRSLPRSRFELSDDYVDSPEYSDGDDLTSI